MIGWIWGGDVYGGWPLGIGCLGETVCILVLSICTVCTM